MTESDDPGRTTLYTVGHSNREIDEFLTVLEEAGVEKLVDVRSYPQSRRFPWFSEGNLSETLEKRGIRYTHVPSLGGGADDYDRDAPVGALPEKWRPFAAHMQTETFTAALDGVLEDGREGTTAIMCAEREPERCHRQLIADAVVARGWGVIHLIRRGERRSHELRQEARTSQEGVVYPASQADLPL